MTPRFSLRLLLCLALLGLAGGCAGTRSRSDSIAPAPPSGESSVKPGINADFLKPDLDPAGWVERFEKEGREVFDRRAELVKALRLRPGMTVADVGAGTGLFTFPIADAVGKGGKVYAVDIAPVLLAHIRRRAAEEGRPQVEPVLGGDRDARLPAGKVDAVFICDTYHHFEYPASMLASIRQALKPRGELLLVEFKRIPGQSTDWILGHVRAGQPEFEAEILAAGFEKVEEPVRLKDNYVVRFRRSR